MKHVFYKREFALNLKDSPLADPMPRWEAWLDDVARRGFTGIVFYTEYHPFQQVLSYDHFPHAAVGRPRDRERIRNKLNAILHAARARGLQTLLQHYVGHFTEPLARHIGLPIREWGGRLAGYEHPEVLAYQRFCYREVFQQCPALSGLVFNYESAPNAGSLVLDTAVTEANAMERKPVFLHRLWGFNDMAAMQRLVKAYRGTSLVAHKITDTKDVYAFARADSRITDWKAALPGTDFLYVVGPCHNCAANLARIVWSDYDFVQDLLKDGAARGCDGFSFHQVNDSIAHDSVPGALNVLHLEAMTDFMAGRHRSPRVRRRMLAAATDCRPVAAADLDTALTALSRPILRTYRQFCADSAHEGYLNPGRHTFTQDPFYYYPATALNDQTRGMWRPVRTDLSWIPKTRPAPVTRAGATQHILDYVDPHRPAATDSPARIAAAIEADCRRATHALARLRRSDPPTFRRLRDPAGANLVSARRAALEIRTAIAAYAIYFCKTRAAARARVREAIRYAAQDRALARQGVTKRERCWHTGMQPSVLRNLKTLKRHLEEGCFRPSAFEAFMASRREYNEIRRTIRGYRLHDASSLRLVRKHLRKALAQADAALRLDEGGRHREPVMAWREFVAGELEHTNLPGLTLTPGAAVGDLPLFRDHAFRSGEDYTEDFLGFFRPYDYARNLSLSLAVAWEPDALVMTLRETGLDVNSRRARWNAFAETDDLSYVFRVYLDRGAQCREVRTFHVLPDDRGLYASGYRLTAAGVIEPCPRRFVPHTGRTATNAGPDRIDLVLRLPFAELGDTPRPGDTWGLNVTAAPEIRPNRQYTWAPQYDSGIGNPYCFGRIRFAAPAKRQLAT